MTTEAENLLNELKDEALRIDSWFKDETKRQNYREMKERQLMTLQNIITALEEKEQSIFEQSIRFPHSKDLEQVILGAILIDSTAIEKVKFLEPEHFYFENHRLIFDICKTCQPIDLVTVAEKLKFRCGGPAYLSELTMRVASSANIEAHARIVVQKSIQRKLIKIGVSMINEISADTDDVFFAARDFMNSIKYQIQKYKPNAEKQIMQ